jgi:hypothetical protein
MECLVLNLKNEMLFIEAGISYFETPAIIFPWYLRSSCHKTNCFLIENMMIFYPM